MWELKLVADNVASGGAKVRTLSQSPEHVTGEAVTRDAQSGVIWRLCLLKMMAQPALETWR